MTPQEKLRLFWDMFKVYANNPNQIISITDRLKNLFGNEGDVFKVCASLGIIPSRGITFGNVLTKIGIEICTD